MKALVLTYVIIVGVTFAVTLLKLFWFLKGGDGDT